MVIYNFFSILELCGCVIISLINISKENEEEELLIKFENSENPKTILPAFGSISKKVKEDEEKEFDYLSGIEPRNDDDFSEYFDN